MTDTEYAKLKWRCRRGMKELDQLMLRYLEVCYPTATQSHQAAFKTMLDYEEPVLYGLFSGRLDPDTKDIEDVIKAIQSSPVINFS